MSEGENPVEPAEPGAASGAASGPYGIQTILQTLPHRYPFLLVDRILSFEPGKRVVGLKNVTYNEEFFQGHFPGNPVMPGVLIVEAMAQVGGFLVMYSPGRQGQVIYLAGVDKARFRRPVVPGDQLVISADFLWMKRGVVRVKGEARVDGQLCAEAELMSGVGPVRSENT